MGSLTMGLKDAQSSLFVSATHTCNQKSLPWIVVTKTFLLTVLDQEAKNSITFEDEISVLITM